MRRPRHGQATFEERFELELRITPGKASGSIVHRETNVRYSSRSDCIYGDPPRVDHRPEEHRLFGAVAGTSALCKLG